MGRKGTYLYNLPEVASARKYLGVQGCSARFGTDPAPWNWAMWLMARLVPRQLLADREFVGRLVALSDPLVRGLDGLVGETVVSSSAVVHDLTAYIHTGCAMLTTATVASGRRW